MSERNFETLEAGATYETRENRKVRILAERTCGLFVGEWLDNISVVESWRPNGNYFEAPGNLDLIRKIESMPPLWLNVADNRAGNGVYVSVHNSFEAAENDAPNATLIARLKVEYTRGRFDS